MSVIYPALNSKGISWFAKAEHGATAGIILFFTCGGATLGPLAMGALSDFFGGLRAGIAIATTFAGLLFSGLFFNWLLNPRRDILQHSDEMDYGNVDARHIRLPTRDGKRNMIGRPPGRSPVQACCSRIIRSRNSAPP